MPDLNKAAAAVNANLTRSVNAAAKQARAMKNKDDKSK